MSDCFEKDGLVARLVEARLQVLSVAALLQLCCSSVAALLQLCCSSVPSKSTSLSLVLSRRACRCYFFYKKIKKTSRAGCVFELVARLVKACMQVYFFIFSFFV
jgi:hypothetical protein